MNKVSVIIPNYNYENYIVERIDSVLKQSYKIHELIILDDASPDNSVEIINKKIKTIKDVKVKFIKNKKNSGSVFSQWQKGLKEVTGDYFWIAEADDSCNKDFLKEAMTYFDKHKNIILFYSESKKMDENGNFFANDLKDYADIFNSHKWDNSYVNKGKDEIIESLSNNNTILNVSSVVWKKEDIYYDIFEQAKKYKVAGDWYIYSKVLEHGDIAFSNKPLNYFRKHSKSTSTTVNPNIEYKEVLEIQESIRKKYYLPKDIVEKQKMRRRFMGFCENDTNTGKHIAAILFDKYSKKDKKRISKLNKYLKDMGYKCDIYFNNSYTLTAKQIYDDINNSVSITADIFTDYILNKEYDVIISTSKKNKEFVENTNINKKIYLTFSFIDISTLNKQLGGTYE